MTGSRLLIALIACCWLVACTRDGPSPQPARIVSGSMAPGLWGECWRVRCGDCGLSFACGVEHRPDNDLAVCPNCGNPHVRFNEQQWLPGDAVEMKPRDFTTQPPQRWEIVAFREHADEAGDPERVAVKRVVGLPRERIAIRGGDLFVGGKRLQKSYIEWLAARQLVHDNNFLPPPSDELRPRWRAAEVNSGWTADFSSFDRQARAREPGAIDWLEYHHWSGAATPTPRAADTEIRDNDSYNQGLSRALNLVRDVGVDVQAQNIAGGGCFYVRLLGGDQPLAIELTPTTGLVRLLLGADEQDRALLKLPTSDNPNVFAMQGIEVALADGRIIGAVHFEPFAFELPSASLDAPVALALGVREGEWDVLVPSVYRDVHYLNPHGRSGDWKMDEPLGPNEYFLLGDNPPNSVDSRQRGAVHVEWMLGTVDAPR